MKIELESEKNINMFDEMMYILFHYKKILKNPKFKTSKISTFIKEQWMLIFLLFIIIIYYIYLKNSVVASIFSFSLLIIVIKNIKMLIYVNNRKKDYLNNENKSVIIIDEKGIKLERTIEQNIETDWNNINYIIFNKYSICIIPNTKESILVFIDIRFKEKIIEAINKYDKNNLIVDNVK